MSTTAVTLGNPSAPRMGAEALLVDVFASIQVGLFVYELDGADPASMRIRYANAASERLTGISATVIEGSTLREALPELALTDIPGRLVEMARDGQPLDLGDLHLPDRGAGDRTYAVQAFPLPGSRLGVSFLDVTETRRAEQQVNRTLESMSDGFFTLDHEWRITYLNSQGEKLFRAGREDLIGTCLWDRYPNSQGSDFYEMYHRAARERETIEFESFFEPFKTWFAVRVHPTSEGLAIYLMDVTNRHELEAQLHQSQKLEAVGQLAGGIAHDFNNLLTVIDGYAALAEIRLGAKNGDAGVRGALAEIATASRQAASLTNKLLSFSRKQMLQPSIVELNDVVESTVDFIAPLLGAHIAIHTGLTDASTSVLVDAGQVEQAIVNLAVNARDAMPSGGNLWVETSIVELDEGDVPSLGAGEYVRLVVRDDGVGMDESTLSRVFDPFFTTKPVGAGSGLGLSTAYGTVRQSGGRLTAASEFGRGSIFTVFLPRREVVDVGTDSPRHESASIGTDPAGGRVLVVEDEFVVRQLVVEILESNGYAVTEADNPQTALDECGQQSFDLLVTDMVMPGGDGSSLARAALELQPDLTVLYMSGYTPAVIASLEIPGHRTAFLQKPFAADDLTASVRALLEPVAA